MKAKARIIRIGNSRGVRLPKALIAKAGLADEVELDARGAITIRPVGGVRAGWAEAAERLAESPAHGLLDPVRPTDFDRQEWTW